MINLPNPEDFPVLVTENPEEITQAKALWAVIGEIGRRTSEEGVRALVADQGIAIASLLYVAAVRTVLVTTEPNKIGPAQAGMLGEAGLDPESPLQAVGLTAWIDGFMSGRLWQEKLAEQAEEVTR